MPVSEEIKLLFIFIALGYLYTSAYMQDSIFLPVIDINDESKEIFYIEYVIVSIQNLFFYPVLV